MRPWCCPAASSEPRPNSGECSATDTRPGWRRSTIQTSSTNSAGHSRRSPFDRGVVFGVARRDDTIHTTMYWYFRACRAAAVGGGGHLSGPFGDVPRPEQRRAIAAMLQLPVHIGLPEARQTVPRLADVALRHPHLHLLNLEALAAASTLEATIWLSPAGASGVLPRSSIGGHPVGGGSSALRTGGEVAQANRVNRCRARACRCGSRARWSRKH